MLSWSCLYCVEVGVDLWSCFCRHRWRNERQVQVQVECPAPLECILYIIQQCKLRRLWLVRTLWELITHNYRVYEYNSRWLTTCWFIHYVTQAASERPRDCSELDTDNDGAGCYKAKRSRRDRSVNIIIIIYFSFFLSFYWTLIFVSSRNQLD